MHILLRRVVIISIHAPREGSDLAQAMNAFGGLLQFLSTLPVRGATAFAQPLLKFLKISIHAPREGSDTPSAGLRRYPAQFLSTLPVRGATAECASLYFAGHKFLSTLPVRGATGVSAGMGGNPANFYPRSP